MKLASDHPFRILLPAIIGALLAAATIEATTHVVNFGGSLGFAYSPSSFTAHVGDTVAWEGDFGMHPLSSTTIPAGAKSFHAGSGMSFSYIIAVAGNYNYQCDFHHSAGMVGSFEATSASARNDRHLYTGAPLQPLSLKGNGTAGPLRIRFQIPAAGFASLKIADLQGRIRKTFTSGFLPAGSYEVMLDGRSLADGFYCALLTSTGKTDAAMFQIQ